MLTTLLPFFIILLFGVFLLFCLYNYLFILIFSCIFIFFFWLLNVLLFSTVLLRDDFRIFTAQVLLELAETPHVTWDFFDLLGILSALFNHRVIGQMGEEI